MSGTSMAAPHVTGTAALYLEGHRSAHPRPSDALVAQATTGKVTDAKTGSPNPAAEDVGHHRRRGRRHVLAGEPRRILDTRVSNAKVAPNSSATLQVTGRGGIPTTGWPPSLERDGHAAGRGRQHHGLPDRRGQAERVEPELRGGPDDPEPRDRAARLGRTRDARQQPGGSSHLIADRRRYYVSGTPTAAGTFASLNPARISDTRTGAAVAANGVRGWQVAGAGAASRPAASGRS